ncbi:UCH-domain-containing protein [Sistotremastrum niveocremeum HHB9708]|uniref:ubiquitinyl hydrolase 1 n=1 Tax=Sistotremastrum niveocremeum HHB9708 TaxID=1314777 RepID=A0A164VVT7_9AGAM|nr:UCH-domain-containing protein [Sistotremastrum niveocremeum HHB9708]
MSKLPSPAPTPPLEPTSLGKKRMRSASDSSAESESSPKRAVSEVPSQPSDSNRSPESSSSHPPSVLPTTSDDFDIDKYMEEQDAGPSIVPNEQMPPSNASAPQKKFAQIKELKSRPMIEGETWYIVQRDWFRKWENACSGQSGKEELVDESTIGPVDNSIIADAEGEIRSEIQIQEGTNVEYVPQEVWDLFTEWYGQCERPLPRHVILNGLRGEPGLEIHPLQLKAYILKHSTGFELSGPPPPEITISKKASLKQLSEELAGVFGLAASDDIVRVWHIDAGKVEEDGEDGSEYTPARLKREYGSLLKASAGARTLEDALIESNDIFVVDTKLDNQWISEKPITSPFKFAAPIPFAGMDPGPVFGSGAGQDFFSKMSPPSTSSVIKSASKSLEALTPSSLSTRSRSPFGKPPGTVGLMNLGNTCFMNSAIQGLAHAPELTDYFLTGLFRQELNPDNPLGMQGAIAESFGALLHRLWQSGSSGSFSPREFKQVLAKFAPQFSGYQQHDAQELVAFLLDGLHEDLNRVLKKPYVEKPDWEGGGERELIEFAKKSWDGYMLRNDSVIVDLFQGQYKSTLVCPECSKVSITFDPFMYLTLPIPVVSRWKQSIYFIPWDNAKPHVQIPVETPREASVKDLKQLLGRWTETIPENLLTFEVWSHRIYKEIDDTVQVSDIAERDNIVCFELPCNAQQSKNFKPSPTDPFILPVFMNQQTNLTRPVYGNFQNNSNSGFKNPFIVVLTPEESATKEQIYAAVTDRLVRWTPQHSDLYSWQGVSHSTSDQFLPLKPSESITEIRENGDVVTVEEPIPDEEDDIVDLKTAVIDDQPTSMDVDEVPKKLGPKPDIFKLTLHASTSRVAKQTLDKSDPLEGPVDWEVREKRLASGISTSSQSPPVSLLKRGDWLVCEWDIHMREYYFGPDKQDDYRFPLFEHPEYLAAQEARNKTKKKGITLDECLDEFTKEEQLGEDDLWYCPRCKKHQQATKKFDLWKAPDVLVVHLKRFSNSRIIRDKIDALVEFPIEGLDLEYRVEERVLARKLQDEGVEDYMDLKLDDIDEPLLYDLFSVTEHMGGLGGGHYRAYAKNHIDGNWYHFDDSHVSPAEAKHAVNNNAYLLFYRRRTAKPLGGKTHEKVADAKRNGAPDSTTASQLPTPPNEEPLHSFQSSDTRITSHISDGTKISLDDSPPPLELPEGPDSFLSSSALPFDEDEPFTTADPIERANMRFDHRQLSPVTPPSTTSSQEAEMDESDLLDTFSTSNLDGISDFDEIGNVDEGHSSPPPLNDNIHDPLNML